MPKTGPKRKKERPYFQEKLGELVISVFGFRQIDIDPKKGKQIQSYTITLTADDLVVKSNQTATYRNHFEKIFSLAFYPPQEVDVIIKRQNKGSKFNADNQPQCESVIELIKNTITSFLGQEIKELEDNTSSESTNRTHTSPLDDILYKWATVDNCSKLIQTDDSLFEVIRNYKDYKSHGSIPFICTAAQWESARKEYELIEKNTQSSTDSVEPTPVQPDSGQSDSVDPKRIIKLFTPSIDVLFDKYPQELKKLASPIGTYIVKKMLPILFDEKLPENDLKEKYERTLQDFTAMLQMEFEELVLSLPYSQTTSEITKIIMVDPDYEPGTQLIKLTYNPDLAPLLINWKIPTHRYIRYQKPDVVLDDLIIMLKSITQMNDYLLHRVLTVSEQCVSDNPISNHEGLIDQDTFQKVQIQYIMSRDRLRLLLDKADPTDDEIKTVADQATIDQPISESQIKYRQDMFNELDIDYLVQRIDNDTPPEKIEKLLRLGQSPFIRLITLSETIADEIRRREEGELRKYWKSITDSIENILKSIKLFSNELISVITEQEPDAQNSLCHQNINELILSWPVLFQHNELLMLKEDTFSALVPQGLLLRHYLLQWEHYPDLKVYLGNDYITDISTKQLAFILIPLIGEFVSELEENMGAIAHAAGVYLPPYIYKQHLVNIGQYLSDAHQGDWEHMIKQWNDCYDSVRIKVPVTENRYTKPDDRYLGLKAYAKVNGNLFQNLKNALEGYRACLKKSITEDT